MLPLSQHHFNASRGLSGMWLDLGLNTSPPLVPIGAY